MKDWLELRRGIGLVPTSHYACAHLHNRDRGQDFVADASKARLIVFDWNASAPGGCRAEIRLALPDVNVAKASLDGETYSAIIDPNFPKSLLSSDIPAKLNLVPPAILSLPTSRRDTLRHEYFTSWKCRCSVVFERDSEEFLAPTLGPLTTDWEVLSDDETPFERFVLIGADLLAQMVTVLCRSHVFVGGDNGNSAGGLGLIGC